MQNILLNGYLSSGFYYCHKAMTKATCGEKGLFGCNFHITVHHLKNLNREESQRQELIQKAWRDAAYSLGTIHYCLLRLIYHRLQDTSPYGASATMGWNPPPH